MSILDWQVIRRKSLSYLVLDRYDKVNELIRAIVREKEKKKVRLALVLFSIVPRNTISRSGIVHMVDRRGMFSFRSFDQSIVRFADERA